MLRELVQQDEVDALPLMEAIEESLRDLHLQKRGGTVQSAIQGAKDFFRANPLLVTGAAALAVDAYMQYKKNKRNTIRLHAKTDYEKRMMTSIVDALTKEGTYAPPKIKFEGGGKTWILKRKWT